MNTTEKAARLAISLTEAGKTGGGSFYLTGEPVRTGYTVGGYLLLTEDALAIYPAATANPFTIALDLIENWAAIERADGVGCWVSGGVFYLDAITIHHNIIEAAVTGLTRKQQAIGLLTNGNYEEIPVNKGVTV